MKLSRVLGQHPHKVTTMPETGSENKRRDMVAVDHVLAGLFASKEWTTQWRLFLLIRKWPDIVGLQVARLTAPAFFRRETLWISVQDAAWMHHLQYLKPELIQRVNQHLAEQPITDLRWRLFSQEPSVAKPEVLPPPMIAPQEERAFFQMTTCIGNQDCRQALQRLWRSLAPYSQKK